MVELRERDRVAVHLNVADTVDAILRGQLFNTQIRFRNEKGEIEYHEESSEGENETVDRPSNVDFGMSNIFGAQTGTYGPARRGGGEHRPGPRPVRSAPRTEPVLMHIPGANTTPRNGSAKTDTIPVGHAKPLRIFAHGINRNRLEQAIKEMSLPADIVREVNDADLVMTLKNYYRQKPLSLRQAESGGVPIHIIKNNTVSNMKSHLGEIFGLSVPVEEFSTEQGEGFNNSFDPVKQAMLDTEEAISKVIEQGAPVDLPPQNAFIRRLQHQMAERYNLLSTSKGREPFRRVRIYPQ
jgi:hypothetical protein